MKKIVTFRKIEVEVPSSNPLDPSRGRRVRKLPPAQTTRRPNPELTAQSPLTVTRMKIILLFENVSTFRKS